MALRLVLGASTLLISAAAAAAAAFTILNPNHPCSNLIAAGHPEKALNTLATGPLRQMGTTVEQTVDEQFNPQEFCTTASLCFTTAVQDGFDALSNLSNLLAGLQQGQ